jgi:hypothetical protein
VQRRADMSKTIAMFSALGMLSAIGCGSAGDRPGNDGQGVRGQETPNDPGNPGDPSENPPAGENDGEEGTPSDQPPGTCTASAPTIPMRFDVHSMTDFSIAVPAGTNVDYWNDTTSGVVSASGSLSSSELMVKVTEKKTADSAETILARLQATSADLLCSSQSSPSTVMCMPALIIDTTCNGPNLPTAMRLRTVVVWGKSGQIYVTCFERSGDTSICTTIEGTLTLE